MKRRDFLVAAGSVGITGSILPELVLAAPCPPPTLALDGDAPISTSCLAGSVTPFRLTSAVGGSLLPYTVGQPFRRGDIPSGEFIGSTAAEFQAEVRNRWPDGSVKFAVLSGRQTLSAGLASSIAIRKTSAVPTGTNIVEPPPATLGSTISVMLTNNGAGTYTPQAAATAGTTTWNRTTPRKVREMLGPVMSEFHYYTPTSDANLTIWWYLRVYSDRTEVETCIEQGWARVAGGSEKSYGVTVTIGGTLRYTATIAHRFRSRWSRRDWIGTDPQITTAHDRAYLCSTKLIPNYASTPVTSAALNGLVQAAAPMTRGNITQAAAGGGYHPHLGILPMWDAAYAISGDVRAYRGMLANEQASSCGNIGPGNGGVITRDETTGLPAAHVDFLSESYAEGGGALIVNNSDVTARPWTSDTAHGLNSGYMPYLATGRWYSLETCQHMTITDFLAWGTGSGQSFRIGEDRQGAWTMRTKAAALAITPDTHPLRAKYISHLNTFVGLWRTNEVGLNALGIRQRIYNNTGYGSGFSVGTFQQYFITQCFAFAQDVAGSALSSAAQTQLSETVQFHCLLPVGMAGTRPGGFCYRSAANYGLTLGPTTFPASFGAWYDVNVGTGQVPADNVCATGQTLLSGNFPEPTSYWGNFLPALAYAVDVGVTGATAAYSRVTGASNWLSFFNALGDAPQFSVIPR